MAPLEVVTASPYSLFYTLAVVAAAWLTFDAGRRRGWSPVAWGMAVAAWAAGGVIGAMLPRVLLGDAVAVRTSIGAVIVATLALALAAKAIGRRPAEALDTTSVALPIGAAIVRIGCFIGECCEGLATSLPIGVALHADDVPRHPVQLYEASLEVLLAGWLTRGATARRPGRQFTASVLGMCAIRFATEFVRANEKIGGLSLAQWVVLPIGALCLLVLLSRPGDARPYRVLTASARQAAIALVGALVIAALAVELTALETTALMVVAVGLTTLAIRQLGHVTPAGMAVLALQVPPITADTTWPRHYRFFGVGANAGTWEATHRYSNCDGTGTEDWSRHHSSLGGLIEAGGRRQDSPYTGFGFRAKGFFGRDNVGRALVKQGTPVQPGPFTQTSAGVSLAGDFDWKNFGLILGVSAGHFYPIAENSTGPGGVAEPIKAMPAVGIRVGPLRGLSVEARVGDESPMWTPAPAASLSVGLGDSVGNRLRIGVAEAGLVLVGRRMTADGFEIVPSVVIGGPEGGSEFSNVIHGGIMFRRWVRVGPRPPTER